MGAKNSIPGKQSGPAAQWAPGYKLMDAVAVSSTTVYTSEIFNMSNLDNMGLQVKFTGTPTGTLTIQVSVNNSTWDTLPTADINPSVASPSGSATDTVYSIKATPFPYLRVSYTNASSTGTLSVWICGKDLN